MRILIPFVVHLDEILATREIVADVCADLGLERMPLLGVMVETPALADTLDVVGEHIDFISLGTNDLAQYSLAIDRGNARLQHLVDPLHPALTRAIRRVFTGASAAGLEIAVCGDLAADPVGLGFLLGIGYRDFSLAPTWIPETRELVSSVSVEALETICEGLDDPERARTLRARLRAYLDETVPFEATALSP
jgi:phosphoenolpyruvate-protein kinase (PTS system EI component)